MLIFLSKILQCISLYSKGVPFSTLREFYYWNDIYIPEALKKYTIKSNHIFFGERKFSKDIKNLYYSKFSWFHSFVENHGFSEEDGKYFIQVKVSNDSTYKWRIADTGSLICFSDVFIKEAYTFISPEQYVVIDVGTNIGFSLLQFAILDNVECVYGFEPVKNNYNIATANLDKVSFFKNKISNSPYGLGNRDKTLFYSGVVNNSATFSTQSLAEKAETKDDQTIEIKDAAFVLEAIIKNHPGQKLLVKLDCEGAETEIINRWAEMKLLNQIDCIVLEWHFNNAAILRELLVQNGFLAFSEPDWENARGTGYIRAFRCSIRS